jgi:gamma-glutamyltranspeptidase/glutathione hydrolase
MVDRGMDPQAALDHPRWCLKGVGSERGAGSVLDAVLGVVAASDGGDDEPRKWALANALASRGHKVERVEGVLGRTLFGRGQIIARDEHGVLWGGSDPRGDGCALGL